jgi:membrane-bound metal-dependent hydrolase YbcI (DUF457 family)
VWIVFIVTHTLLPVCLALGVENASLATGRGHVFPRWGLMAIGFFGALPDLCSPHLSLEARYSSGSHTLWFLGVLLPLCAMTAVFFEREGRWKLAIGCWLAAALHLASDAVAGGIPWLRPWRTEILGGYLIPPNHWLWYDLAFLVLTGVGLRLRPFAEARGMRS